MAKMKLLDKLSHSMNENIQKLQISFLVILMGILILAAVVGYVLFKYNSISTEWKVGLLTFIILLPFFFSLIVSLHVNHIKTERFSGLQEKFRVLYNEIQIKPSQDLVSEIKTPKEGETIHDVDFRRYIEQRDRFILNRNSNLFGTYRQMIQIYYENQNSVPVAERDSDQRKVEKESVQRKLLSFEMHDYLIQAVERELISQRLDFFSYLLPLSFFIFTYFSGFIILLPFIESIFSHTPQSELFVIPLFSITKSIPLLVIQWGFLGGLVYTSINLMSRFLRKDLTPRVYLLAALRLLLSSVVAIILFLLSEYMYTYNGYENIPVQLLLVCFVAGVTPIQFLIRFADSELSKIKVLEGWRRRELAGDRPLTDLEGINAIDAQRLEEEGINCIHQMAFCDPTDIAKKTKYSEDFVKDWKDQAVLYILTADLVLNEKTIDLKKGKGSEKIYLLNHLNTRLGIRSMSGLVKFWRGIPFKEHNKDQTTGESMLSILDLEGYDLNATTVYHIFEQIVSRGSRWAKTGLEVEV
jgi:hypothetical protein